MRYKETTHRVLTLISIPVVPMIVHYGFIPIVRRLPVVDLPTLIMGYFVGICLVVLAGILIRAIAESTFLYLRTGFEIDQRAHQRALAKREASEAQAGSLSVTGNDQ